MELLEKYIVARWCYAIGEDWMSDMEYRYVEDKVREKYPDSEYLYRSWSSDPCPKEILQRNGMSKLIKDVSFNNVSESIRSIYNEEEYRTEYAGLSRETRLSLKIDGWNTQVNYYNGEPVSANTRGRSGNFMNADTVLRIVPRKIPLMGKVKVTGEVSIPNDIWKEYKIETGNKSQRASVSTALSREDFQCLSFLAFNIQVEGGKVEGDLFDVAKGMGFQTPMYIKVYNFDTLDRALNLFSKRAKFYNYLSDGVVVSDRSSQVALRIRYWAEKALQSYVTGYVGNRGSYGDSMVVTIQPVMAEGSKKTKVSVTNLQYIADNNLKLGSPIAFDVRSAVGCVLNTSRTRELQMKYEGRYEEYRALIDGERM